MTIRECYAVLELEPGSSLEDVRKAWKLLAAVWHPDRFANNPTLREQAEQKLKRINAAYQTLRRHFESGGSETVDEDESTESSWDSAAYIDSQCWYLGGDVRLRPVSKLEFGGRPAIVRVGSEGITIVTASGADVDETIHYAVETIRCLDVHGTTWAAPGVSFDPRRYQAPYALEANRADIHVTDPEGIVQGFAVSLGFRNDYFRKLFQKRVQEKFCPTNATAACKAELERLAAKRREQELQRQREMQARQTGTASDRDRTGTWAVAISLLLFCGMIVGLAVMGGSGTVQNTKSELPLPANAASAGNFAAWMIPIAQRFGEQPEAGDSPRPGQAYYIVLQVQLPEQQTVYDVGDLSGKVIGTDGYVQLFPAQAYVQGNDGRLSRATLGQPLPVRSGVVRIFIRIPGAEASVKDTIRVRSESLGEEQTLTLLHAPSTVQTTAKPVSVGQQREPAASERSATEKSIADKGRESVPFRVEVFVGGTGRSFLIQVNPEWAPNSAKRFRSLVESGYYGGSTFHPEMFSRSGFVRFVDDVNGAPSAPIDNTPYDSSPVSNRAGYVGFRKLDYPNRRTEFFINTKENSRIDSLAYEVFGEVVEGMDVVRSLGHFDAVREIAIRNPPGSSL